MSWTCEEMATLRECFAALTSEGHLDNVLLVAQECHWTEEDLIKFLRSSIEALVAEKTEKKGY